jgi:hypothetical protein
MICGLELDDGLDDLAAKFNVTLEVSLFLSFLHTHYAQLDADWPGDRTSDAPHCGHDELEGTQDRLDLHERYA